MDFLKILFWNRSFYRVLGITMIFFILILLATWVIGFDFNAIKTIWQGAERFLMKHPWCLFLALVFLPGLPIPTSPLMFLTGLVWRERPIVSCGLCLLALAMNLSWTYWAAAYLGRGYIKKWIAASRYQSLSLQRTSDWQVILLVRLTPGLPLFMQSYFLGFLRVPFHLYLLVSLVCTGTISCGVVLSGAGLAQGNVVPIISGIALIVAGVVLVQFLRERNKAVSDE